MQERQIFWSGGIGDIFALEATFSDEDRLAIRRMFWATRARRQMAPLFARLPNYRNCRDNVCLWDDFPPGFCFLNIEQVAEHCPTRDLLVGPIEDWSILKRFGRPQPYTSSSFLRYRVGNVVRFDLPPEFIVVCPYSAENKESIREWRRFKEDDWGWLLDYLNEKDLLGVVLTTGDDPVPDDPRIINLANKTNLGEAIEVVKRAKGYVGIDTCFSVLSSILFKPENIHICTLNKFLWQFRHVYYPTQTDYSFIKPWLGATEEERLEWNRKSEAIPQKTSEADIVSAIITGSSTRTT